MIAKRQESNRQILAELAEQIEKYPELRFCQLLYKCGLIEQNKDYFYRESIDSLNDMKHNLQKT